MTKAMEGPWLLGRQFTSLVTSPKGLQERGKIKIGLMKPRKAFWSARVSMSSRVLDALGVCGMWEREGSLGRGKIGNK